MDENKLSKIKISLLIFLFIVIFSFAYFLIYSPFRINDNQLLIVTMFFSSLVVAIPLYIFMDDKPSSTVKVDNTNKPTKKRKKQKKRG